MARTRKPISQKIKDTVRISDYSDLELMEVIHDLGYKHKNGNVGNVRTEDISRRLFGNVTKRSEVLRYANMCVTSRMNWMRRFGFIEKVEDTKGQWRLSDAGEELRSSKIPQRMTTLLDQTQDRHMLSLANHVGQLALHTGDVAFRAMERQLRFNIIQRKRER